MQLRRVPVFEQHFQSAVVIEVCKRERTTVLGKVDSSESGDIGKSSVTIVGIENVSLVSAPGSVRADEFVDGVPALFILRGG